MQKSYIGLDVPISLPEVRKWGLLVVGCAYWGNVIRTGWDPGTPVLLGLVQSITGNGAFAVGAWVVIVLLASRSVPGATASGRAIAATFAACLPAALPSEQTVMLSMLALSAQWFRSRESQANRTVALLLCALAGNIFWTSSYLLPMHATVALLDTRATHILLQLCGATAGVYGNLVINATGQNGLEILAQCSSSFPVSGVCLAFIVTMVCMGQTPSRRHMSWLMASLMASVALTEVRLLWMASSQGNYVWLHDGDGRVLYSLAAVLLATLFPLLATRAGRKSCA